MYQSQSDIVYGAAHHAFTFLVNRYGEEAVRNTLAAMAAGQVFPEAFAQAVGIPPKAFVLDFEHYVRWRAFRGGRARRPLPAQPPVDAAGPAASVTVAPAAAP